MRFSVHVASQVMNDRDPFHFPGILGTGIGVSAMLVVNLVIPSGPQDTHAVGGESASQVKLRNGQGIHPLLKYSRVLTGHPDLGTSLEVQRSTLKLLTLSLLYGRQAIMLHISLPLRLSGFSAPSLKQKTGKAFSLAFSSSKYSNMGQKSQRSNSLIIVPSCCHMHHLEEVGTRTRGCFFSTFELRTQSSKNFMLKFAFLARIVSNIAS